MKKIRIGKEFSVRWGLILNGLPAELDKMDIKVVLTLPFGNKKELSYTADRNILVIPVGRNVQPMTGAYTLSLWINKDKDGQTVVDCSPAFCLVASTDEESCTQVQAIKDVLDLGTSEIQLGVQGKSAYQTWLDEGNEGTEEDFLNWLRQPSTEAGTDAQAAAAKATEAAGKADKAAGAANTAAAEAVRIATTSAAQSEQRVTTAIEGLNQSVSQAEQKVSEAVSKAAEATSAAQSAAESATASSAKAEASSSKADASKAEADKAAEAARTATQEAHAAKQGADTAAQSATEAAGRAEAAAQSVNTAISNAAAATDKANASSAKADSSAVKADAATTRATTAAQKAEEMTAAGNKVLPTLEGYKDHLDKITTEYNVSVFHPASGTGNSNKYTLATAIVQVPEELRVAGLVVSFLNESNKVEKWEFQGGTWEVSSFKKPSGGGVHVASRLMHRFRLAQYVGERDFMDMYGNFFEWVEGVHAMYITCPVKAYSSVTLQTELSKWMILVYDTDDKLLHNGGYNKTVDLSNFPNAAYLKIGIAKETGISTRNPTIWQQFLRTYVVQEYYEADLGLSLLLQGYGFKKNKDNTYSYASLTDLSEADALNIVNTKWFYKGLSNPYSDSYNLQMRALLMSNNNNMTFSNSLWSNYYMLEIASFCKGKGDSFIIKPVITHFLSGCVSLREIWGILDFKGLKDTAKFARQCWSLQFVKIKNLEYNLLLSDTRYINYESLKYAVDNASNSSPITITVHKTTYSYLTGATPPTEQVGGTTEEWQALVTTAAGKQISFVTA